MKSKSYTVISIAAIAAMMTSCGAFKTYVASYDIGLKSVESPANTQKQFGETKIATFSDGNLDKYRYEDDYIAIVWYVGTTQFYFDLTNKSGNTLKINWDDISYVDYQGKTGRMMHSGVKYTDRNNSQPASTIPKGASLSDILLPTDNVYYLSGQYGGWQEKYLIPCVYRNAANRATEAPSFIGKTMTIMMPILIENIQNDYTFTFSIDKLKDTTK